MAFFDFMKHSQKNKRVEHVDSKQIQEIRGAVHVGFDKPEKEKAVEGAPIRLCYVALDGVKEYDSSEKKDKNYLRDNMCV